MLLPALREEVVRYAQQMALDRLVTARQGNVSARDSESKLIAITPTAMDYSRMAAADIVIINDKGEVVEGRWRPTSEAPLHTHFYQNRPDIGAVIHCHAPFTSVFAASYETLPLVLAEAAACLGHPVRVAPYVTPGTQELGEVCLATLGQGSAVIMGGHGLAVVGPDLPHTYSAAVAVEDNARTVIYARSMGAALRTIPQPEVARLHQHWLKAYKQAAISG